MPASSPEPLPPSLSSLLNVPDTFRWRGQDYRLADLTFEQHAEFAAWVKANAYREVEVGTADYPEDARRLMFSQVNMDVAAGLYDPGGAAAARALLSVSGASMALWLGLKAHDPTVRLEQATQMVRAALAERDQAIASADLKAAVAKAVSDPPG